MPKLSPVSYRQLVKVFEVEGFRCVRTEGDHLVFTKPGVIRPVVIPKYTCPWSKFDELVKSGL
jgi:predicted RNA binding protein YcfA (HicA-like mRNA interferase family)